MCKNISEFLSENLLVNESFVNLFSENDKKKYVDEVWVMIQKAYASQGGMHGNGFQTKEDMISNIHFWKLCKKNDKIVCIAMYKDKDGRKRVAIATNGTDEGKIALLEIMTQDLKQKRCYVELSGRSLRFLASKMNILDAAVSIDDVRKKLNEEIRMPASGDSEIAAHPKIKEFFYQRKIGGEWHTKIMLGNINAEPIVV